ncbi:hypothetical protein HK102_013412 [Quaeritorhiza haematococci]|nr:hypothetical protein HK102_013412 [Quaeritorhiza haematococci]
MTYNVLAQCLVKRELFPYTTKNDLKAKPRMARIINEITNIQQPDIACLQEVDFFDEIYAPQFRSAGYDYVYMKKNPKKPSGHGICILWKRNKFTKHDYREINFDDHPLTHPTNISPVTNNIGQILALKFINGNHVGSGSTTSPADGTTGTPNSGGNNVGALVDSQASQSGKDSTNKCAKTETTGIVVTNHHLYWRYDALFQKLRQCYVMLEEALAFRRSLLGVHHGKELGKRVDVEVGTSKAPVDGSDNDYNPSIWPLILCGDFNMNPHEGPYAIVTRHPVLMHDPTMLAEMDPAIWLKNHPVEEQSLSESTSAENVTASDAGSLSPKSDSETKSQVTEVEVLTPITLPDMISRIQSLPRLHSAYMNYRDVDKEHTVNPNWLPLTADASAAKATNPYAIVGEGWQGEPSYTSFTGGWKGTLDYIFLAVPNDTKMTTPASVDESTSDGNADDVSLPRFTKILEIPQVDQLMPGLPNINYGSDHISLMAEMEVAVDIEC